jgi:hypothetical protein
MSAEVRTVTAWSVDTVVFTFPVALEDSSLVFMQWGAHGLEPFPLPHLEETTVVAAPPTVVSGGIRWGMKDRALEPN